MEIRGQLLPIPSLSLVSWFPSSFYLVCNSFPPSFSLLLLLVWSFSEENSPFYHPAVIVFFKNKSFEFHVIHVDVRERQKWKNNENQMLVRSFFFRINFGSLRLLFSQQQNHFSTSKLNKPQLFNILIIHPGITLLSLQIGFEILNNIFGKFWSQVWELCIKAERSGSAEKM